MQRLSLPRIAAAILTAGLAQADWSTDSLSTVRDNLSGVAVGDLVLFAGGLGPTATSDVVDIYDTTSDTWSTAALSQARGGMAVTVVGHLVLFGGGGGPGVPPSDVVDVFDAQTMAWSTASLSAPRFFLAASTVGKKAFFAGGVNASGASDVVDVYDASLGLPGEPAAWSTSTLSVPRAGLAAATVGSQVLFAGGTDYTFSYADVDIYDESTGLWSTALLSQARSLWNASTTVGDLAFFAGGQIDGAGTMSDVVDIYDGQSGTWSSQTLSVARTQLAATSVGNTALFAGGASSFSSLSDVVDLFNAGTGKWETASLSQARMAMGVASTGVRAFFAGGARSGGKSKVVDIYQPVGLNYCTAAANSTGAAASISASGSASLSANDLMLTAICLPDTFCLFFHGPTQADLPFGDGTLCVGGALVRILPPLLASGGVAEVAVDLPSAGITTTGTRHFQCWYRDPAAGGAGFNTSDAISVIFVN